MNDELSAEMRETLHDWMEVQHKEDLFSIVAEWLREHDRAVAEKAWDEAAERVDENWFWHDNGRDSNPYRPPTIC